MKKSNQQKIKKAIVVKQNSLTLEELEQRAKDYLIFVYDRKGFLIGFVVQEENNSWNCYPSSYYNSSLGEGNSLRDVYNNILEEFPDIEIRYVENCFRLG